MTCLSESQWHQKWKTCETNEDIIAIKQALVAELEAGSPLALKSLVHLMYLVKGKQGNVSFDWDAAYAISLLCCQHIDYNQATFDKQKFLNTMYHVIHSYIEQNLIKESLHLRTFIMLTKTNSEEVDESTSACYVSLCQLFFKIASKMEEKYLLESSTIFYVAYLDVMKDCIEILTCNGAQNIKRILNFACRASSCKLDGNVDCLYKLYQFQYNVLSLPKTLESGYVSNIGNDNDLLPYFINLLLLTLETCHKMKAHGKIKDVLTQAGCYKRLLNSNAVFEECVSFIQEILTVLLLFTSSNSKDLEEKLDKCLMHLHNMMPENRTDLVTPVEVTCHNVAHMITAQCTEWWNLPSKEWNRTINVEVMTKLHRVLLEVAEVVKDSDYQLCKSNDTKCPVMLNPRVVGITHFVAFTVNIAMNNKTKSVETLLPQAEVALQQSMEIMGNLRNKGCLHWNIYWKTVATTSFNLSLTCCSDKLWSHAKNFSMQLCQTLLQDLVTRCTSQVDMWQCFRVLSKSYAGLGKNRNALLIYALALTALPDKQDTILTSWCSVKRELDPNSKLQSCTLHNIYTEDEKKLVQIYPAFQLSKLNIGEFLTMEIQVYIKYGMNSNAISAAINQLTNYLSLKDHIDEKFASVLPGLVKSVWNYHDKQHIESVVDLSMHSVHLMKVELKTSPDNLNLLCIMVEMLYWMFTCQWMICRSKLANEMKNSAVENRPENSETPETGKDVDTDNNCKITPAYKDLNITNESELLIILDRALSYCWKIVESQNIEIQHTSKLQPILETIASIYELFAFETQKLRAWTVYYKLGKVIGDSCYCLTAATHLLGSLPFSGDEHWIQEVDSMERDLVNDTVDPKPESSDKYLILVPLWLSKSRHFFNACQFKQGQCYLQMVLKELPYISYGDRVILYTQANLLLSCYLSLPPSYINADGFINTSNIEEALAAHQMIQTFIKESRNLDLITNYKALTMLFEAVAWCAELFLRIRWAKTIRIIVGAALSVAQNTSLVTRSAQLLILLTKADLLIWNIASAGGSLVGLQHMLELDPQSEIIPTYKEENNVAKESFSKVDSNILVPIMLDADIGNSSPLASPSLTEHPFKLPEFVSHKKDCNCSVCTNHIIQENILSTVFMQAHLYELRGKAKQAANFYHGAIRLKDYIDKKQTKLQEKFVKELDIHLRVDGNAKFKSIVQTRFINDSHQIIMFYADFLAIHSKIELSMKYNKSLRESIEKYNIELHIMQDTMEQWCALFKAQTDHLKTNENMLPIDEANVGESYKDIKTPTGKKNERRNLEVSNNSCGSNMKEDIWFYGNRTRIASSLIFNLSDSESPVPKQMLFKTPSVNHAAPCPKSKTCKKRIMVTQSSIGIKPSKTVECTQTKGPNIVIGVTPKPGRQLQIGSESPFALSLFSDLGNIELVDDVFATPKQSFPPKDTPSAPTTVIRHTKKNIFPTTGVPNVSGEQGCQRSSPHVLKVPQLPGRSHLTSNCNSEKNIPKCSKGALKKDPKGSLSKPRILDSNKNQLLNSKVGNLRSKSESTATKQKCNSKIGISLGTSDSTYDSSPLQSRGRRVLSSKTSKYSTQVKMASEVIDNNVINESVTSDTSVIETSYDPVLSAKCNRVTRKVTRQTKENMQPNNQILKTYESKKTVQCKEKSAHQNVDSTSPNVASYQELESGAGKSGKTTRHKQLPARFQNDVKSETEVSIKQVLICSTDSMSGEIVKNSCAKRLFRNRNESLELEKVQCVKDKQKKAVPKAENVPSCRNSVVTRKEVGKPTRRAATKQV